MSVTDPRRRLGAYYTGREAALLLARQVLRRPGTRVLEPSFGDGIFLSALQEVARQRGLEPVRVVAAELDPAAFGQAVSAGLLAPEDGHQGDFFELDVRPVDLVVGNPPYVRLRHLPEAQAGRARQAAHEVLGEPMETSGSVWMPFVLRALRFLAPGGALALVLPFELTYVRYARPLWRVLGERFGRLRVLRVRQRLFPEILQDVVLLLAEDHGGRTTSVDFQAFETVDDLLADTPSVAAPVPLSEVVAGERAFLRAHLDPALQGLLADLGLGPLRPRCRFRIGYVAGDKAFFHPPDAAGLPARSLRPALASGRTLRGLRTSALPATRLFYPDPARLGRSEAAWIQHGEGLGVHRRYKCRVRDPWYVVPDVRVPDLLLSVFAERPVLARNDAGLVASNSLLCGDLAPGERPEAFLASWYSSLTLLGCELEVHALGGGVMVLVPREAGRIPLPRVERTAHLPAVDEALAQGDLEGAYAAGDQAVLRQTLGLSAAQADLVRQGVHTLARWRTSARRRPTR